MPLWLPSAADSRSPPLRDSTTPQLPCVSPGSRRGRRRSIQSSTTPGALARRLDLDDKDMHELTLLSCKGSLSPTSASSKAFGFVSFKTTEDAQTTLEVLDGVRAKAALGQDCA